MASLWANLLAPAGIQPLQRRELLLRARVLEEKLLHLVARDGLARGVRVLQRGRLGRLRRRRRLGGRRRPRRRAGISYPLLDGALELARPRRPGLELLGLGVGPPRDGVQKPV